MSTHGDWCEHRRFVGDKVNIIWMDMRHKNPIPFIVILLFCRVIYLKAVSVSQIYRSLCSSYAVQWQQPPIWALHNLHSVWRVSVTISLRFVLRSPEIRPRLTYTIWVYNVQKVGVVIYNLKPGLSVSFAFGHRTNFNRLQRTSSTCCVTYTWAVTFTPLITEKSLGKLKRSKEWLL